LASNLSRGGYLTRGSLHHFSRLIIFGLGLILLNPTVILPQQQVPEWFAQLPEAPPKQLFAVGVAGKYLRPQRARAAALQDAYRNLAKQILVKLKFELIELSDGRLQITNPKFDLRYYDNRLDDIELNSVILDSVITAEGYFVIIAYPAEKKSGGFGCSLRSWGPAPEWVSHIPKDRDYVYGIGMVARYGRWLRAWQDADALARFDVAKNIQVEVQSLHTSQRDDRHTIESTTRRQSLDLTLRNATIIARWYDCKSDTYYSLCRAPRQ